MFASGDKNNRKEMKGIPLQQPTLEETFIAVSYCLLKHSPTCYACFGFNIKVRDILVRMANVRLDEPKYITRARNRPRRPVLKRAWVTVQQRNDQRY